MMEWLCRGDSIRFFFHQIQSEYYGGNRYVSIEGIEFEYFSASNQKNSSLTYEAVSCQAVFHSFLSDEWKQYAPQTAAHIKNIMELLQNIKFLMKKKYYMGEYICMFWEIQIRNCIIFINNVVWIRKHW